MTGDQSKAELYQRLKKWYLILPCLTLSIIKYLSRVKWSSPGKGVALSPTPRCSRYWKGSLWVALDQAHQLYLLKINESEKIDKYLDLVRDLKKLYPMKIKEIPIVVSGLEMVSKIIEKGLGELKIRGRMKIFPTSALLRSVRILIKVLETFVTCSHSNFSENHHLKQVRKTHREWNNIEMKN